MRLIDAHTLKTVLNLDIQNSSPLCKVIMGRVLLYIDEAPTVDANITEDESIAAVYSWFAAHMPKILKLDDNAEFSITYPTSEYELVMRRKKQNGGTENETN